MQSYFFLLLSNQPKAPCCSSHSRSSWLNVASSRPLLGNSFNSNLSSINVDTIHKPEIKEPAHLNRAKGNNRLLLRMFTDNYTHFFLKKKKVIAFACMSVYRWQGRTYYKEWEAEEREGVRFRVSSAVHGFDKLFVELLHSQSLK